MKTKKPFWAMILLISASFAQNSRAQNLLDTPLGIVFDTTQNRYLVANYTGEIVQINADGSQSYFLTGLSQPIGLVLEGGLLYVDTNNPDLLLGIDLETAAIVKSISIPTSGLLDGFTSDGAGNCYIADPAGLIYKVDTFNESYSILVNSGLPPNIQEAKYDDENNRLIVISSNMNSAIIGVDLDDNSISVITNTNIGGFVGIARDGDHNYYFSSMRTNSVHKWNRHFDNPPAVFADGYNYPTGLCWNEPDNVIGISNTNADTVVFVPVEPTFIESVSIPSKTGVLRNFPNPFNNSTAIEFFLNESASVTLTIYDLLGRKICTPIREEMRAGNYSVMFSDNELSSGLYYCLLQADDKFEKNAMLLLR